MVHVGYLGDPHIDAPAKAFHALAESSDLGHHRLTSRAADADIVLFTQAHMLADDWRLATIAGHPLARRFPERVFVYDERDRPWCAFPGVYVSMPRRLFDPYRQRAWGYYKTPCAPASTDPDLLFSFMGSPSARCREPLFALRHPDAMVGRVEGFTFFDPGSVDFERRRARFAASIARSRFVLCPRGRGTSSIRLYETMAAGRVPVIIADEWMAPIGPHWDALSLRWPEGQTDGLVEMLSERVTEWPRMAQLAREAHQQFFSDPVSARRILDLCESLNYSGGGAHRPRRQLDRGYLEAGIDAARWRAEASVRRRAKRLISRGRRR
jgi:hypothetical protein